MGMEKKERRGERGDYRAETRGTIDKEDEEEQRSEKR